MAKKYPKKQGLESRINAFYFPVRCFDGFSYASFWKYGLFTGESCLTSPLFPPYRKHKHIIEKLKPFLEFRAGVFRRDI